MPTVAATCPYVPGEWIAAHGLRFRRVVPSAGSGRELVGAAAGLCPYARASMNSLAAEPRPDAAVFTTACDQMRRAAEVFAGLAGVPTFLMNVPSTWQTPSSLDLYTDELRRLGRFLVDLGAAAPTPDDLARVMRNYDAARARLRAARETLGPRHYAEAWARLDASGPWHGHPARGTLQDAVNGPLANPGQEAHATPPARGAGLALIGGPMLDVHFDLFDLVERFGGRIVLTAVEGGELTAPDFSAVPRSSAQQRAMPQHPCPDHGPPPRGGPWHRDTRASCDPLAELARAYHQTVPHPSRRPNTLLHQRLRHAIEAAGPRGILFLRYLWCDLWHAELARVREWAAVPVLDVDVGDRDAGANLASRVQAFIETLL